MMGSGPELSDGADGLETLWRSLPTPAGLLLEAQRVADWPGGAILAAVDSGGRRHVLIAVPAAEGFRVPRPTRGLHAEVRRLRIHQAEEKTWIDLSCPEAALQRLFSSFAHEVVSILSASPSADPSLVTRTAERWRKFWSVSADGLGIDAQIGLIGELWLLTRWLPLLTRPAVQSWQGPFGGRHDFFNAHLSVEVKTSGSRAGPTIHRIASLDQLAPPVSGVLYLMSLRLVDDPLGEVNLDEMIMAARRQAGQDDLLADDLDIRLAAVGWTPADSGRYIKPWRLVRQALYEVRDGFPRLTADSFSTGLPVGIIDVGYELDMTSCREWLVAENPRTTSRLTPLTLDR